MHPRPAPVSHLYTARTLPERFAPPSTLLNVSEYRCVGLLDIVGDTFRWILFFFFLLHLLFSLATNGFTRRF